MYVVKVFIADAAQIAVHAEDIIGRIPGYYAGQYRRIKRKQEADQELTAGFLLNKYLGISCDEQIIRSEHGKPALRSGKFYFNLSHSGKYVALAIADVDIGVDIEQVMEVHWPTAGKVFTSGQRELLEHTPKPEQPQQFTRMWTEYEAGLKLTGTGFAAPSGKEAAWEVRSVSYGTYMLSCAAYGQFELSVEETVWTDDE